jgi:hypothetical protein
MNAAGVLRAFVSCNDSSGRWRYHTCRRSLSVDSSAILIHGAFTMVSDDTSRYCVRVDWKPLWRSM